MERAYLVWPHCASIRKSMAVLSRVVLASYTIYSTHVLLKLATSMIILDGMLRPCFASMNGWELEPWMSFPSVALRFYNC